MHYQKRQKKIHEPVLVKEVVEFFGLGKPAHLKNSTLANIYTNKNRALRRRFIDATVGTGGHSEELIKKGALILGIDADSQMLEIARENLKRACPSTFSLHERGCFKLVHGNFRNLTALAKQAGFEGVDGVLLDLGVSSPHFRESTRGFSFKVASAPLDMRIDRSIQKVTAADLLNSLRRDQLEDLFGETLRKGEAKRLSEKVIGRREAKPFRLVGDFLEVTSVLKKKGRMHPATRAFLALRVAINSELENLRQVLPQALELLKERGRLIVISFHSGEDKVVKSFYKEVAISRRGKILTKKPLLPSSLELSRNPLARSAKLRVFEKS